MVMDLRLGWAWNCAQDAQVRTGPQVEYTSWSISGSKVHIDV